MFKLKRDRVTEDGWDAVMDILGMKSIKGRAPILDNLGMIKRRRRK